MKEFYSIQSLETPGKKILKKVRNSFMFENNNFVIDSFKVGDLSLCMLIIQGHKDKSSVVIPEIILKNTVAEIACKFKR